MYKLGFSYAFSHETITTTKTLNKSIFLFAFGPLCNPPSHLSHAGVGHEVWVTVIMGRWEKAVKGTQERVPEAQGADSPRSGHCEQCHGHRQVE